VGTPCLLRWTQLDPRAGRPGSWRTSCSWRFPRGADLVVDGVRSDVTSRALRRRPSVRPACLRRRRGDIHLPQTQPRARLAYGGDANGMRSDGLTRFVCTCTALCRATTGRVNPVGVTAPLATGRPPVDGSQAIGWARLARSDGPNLTRARADRAPGAHPALGGFLAALTLLSMVFAQTSHHAPSGDGPLCARLATDVGAEIYTSRKRSRERALLTAATRRACGMTSTSAGRQLRRSPRRGSRKSSWRRKPCSVRPGGLLSAVYQQRRQLPPCQHRMVHTCLELESFYAS